MYLPGLENRVCLKKSPVHHQPSQKHGGQPQMRRKRRPPCRLPDSPDPERERRPVLSSSCRVHLMPVCQEGKHAPLSLSCPWWGERFCLRTLKTHCRRQRMLIPSMLTSVFWG